MVTQHQREKLDEIHSYLEDGYRRIVLQGSAGVGKTYLVNTLLDELGRTGAYVTAPTHKALSVLQGKIDNNEDGDIQFKTIHSALSLKMDITPQGKKVFVQKINRRYPPFRGCKVLIIDEASMLDSKLIGHLKDYDFPIVFIGDNKQINPVNEESSPIFNMNYPTIELTEIIRQGRGNPIIDLSRDLKRIWEYKPDFIEQEDNRLGFLYTTERQKIINKLAEVNGTDELKYLAWTNNEVDIMNQSVRHAIYGDNPALVEVGETLVFNRGYSTTDKDYFNNEELLVASVDIGEKSYSIDLMTKFKFKVYLVNEGIPVIHEESIGYFKQSLRVVKAMAINKTIEWIDYYKFMETFADFKYNHALTVHKSQGSTYKDVIMNVKDISRNRKKEEKQRLFYTGITRASNLLILYNV